MPDWCDLVARARGLSGRLLGKPRLVEAAHARDLPLVADLLARSGYSEIGEGERSNPVALERHARRVAAARLAILANWSGSRLALLAPLYEDEDRRTIRAIVRGVLAGVPIEQRLSGVVPTPELSEAAIAELARQPNVSQVAALLTSWRHPFGGALLAEAVRQHPDPFRLEVAIDRRYAERALTAAGRAGAQMLRHVRFQIDMANAWTAVAIAAREVESEPAELFVPGGSALSAESFLEACRAPTAEEARRVLRLRALGTPVARVLADAVPRWRQEDRALAESLALVRREARVDPLGVGVVVQYVLRLRAEMRDLARIIWGITLAMPRGLITDSLVTS